MMFRNSRSEPPPTLENTLALRDDQCDIVVLFLNAEALNIGYHRFDDGLRCLFPNLSMHETLHESLNGNGTVTVYHDDFSIDCK